MKQLVLLIFFLNLGAFIGMLLSWLLSASDMSFSGLLSGFVLWPLFALIAFLRFLEYDSLVMTIMSIGIALLLLTPFLQWRWRYIAVMISMVLINLKTLDAFSVALSA